MPSYTCPICGRTLVAETRDQAPHRPFCSRRCKLIDLGRWFNEEYRIDATPRGPQPDSAAAPDSDR